MFVSLHSTANFPVIVLRNYLRQAMTNENSLLKKDARICGRNQCLSGVCHYSICVGFVVTSTNVLVFMLPKNRSRRVQLKIGPGIRTLLCPSIREVLLHRQTDRQTKIWTNIQKQIIVLK